MLLRLHNPPPPTQPRSVTASGSGQAPLGRLPSPLLVSPNAGKRRKTTRDAPPQTSPPSHRLLNPSWHPPSSCPERGPPSPPAILKVSSRLALRSSRSSSSPLSASGCLRDTGGCSRRRLPGIPHIGGLYFRPRWRARPSTPRVGRGGSAWGRRAAPTLRSSGRAAFSLSVDVGFSFFLFVGRHSSNFLSTRVLSLCVCVFLISISRLFGRLQYTFSQ